LSTISQTENLFHKTRGQCSWHSVAKPFAGERHSLNGLLRDSTVGVAFFDRNLHCRALNGALSRMIGVSVGEQIGKPMHQVFRREAPRLKPAFQRVWGTGRSLANVKFKARLSSQREIHHWLVNFYPVKDELGEVRLVATVFSEVTKRRCVESLLRRIRDKRPADAVEKPALPGEGFTEFSERTFELVKHSVDLLKSSMSLRSQVSEMRLETGLWRLALSLTVSPDQEPVLHPVLAPADSSAGVASPEGRLDENELSSGGPSFRERQVLRYLADGKSNKEIGVVLDISTRTVESYRARIMVKLNLHSTAALVRYAIRQKIVEA
jgi:DNA-binding CsgD family transcriptional regulator